MHRLAPFAFAALAGCATAAVTPALQSEAPPRTPVLQSAREGATFLVAEANAALARRDTEAAVRLAELAVASAPDGAAARTTLARSYVAAGRFDAAVSAWSDAIAVSPADMSARLGRALALLAAGQTSSALEVLNELKPTDNVGLAYALAGDPRGLKILSGAVQAPEATGRTRQNLALAYAIAGNWAQARAVAITDVPADAVPARLAEWTRIAIARPAQRVAILLGAAPAPVDFGRPAVLAPPRPAPRSSEPKPMTAAFQPTPQRSTGWVVQVGAYPSERERAAAAATLASVVPAKGYAPLLDSKATWQRLSLAGFPAKLDAQRLCVRLKASGTDCFVRLVAPSA